jgi:hypothetical protein
MAEFRIPHSAIFPKAKMKFEFRKTLAARPIAEKLRLLNALRQRTLAIRRASNTGAPRKAIVQETPPKR